MATERLAMRQIREILRQKWVLACSHRQVTASLRVSVGTVTAVLRRAAHAGLDWPQIACGSRILVISIPIDLSHDLHQAARLG